MLKQKKGDKMPEWLQNILFSIGGGTVVLVGILTVFKQLFLKLFETGIESSFEKNLEKYKNNLSRTTKAYELLLDREMKFYENIDPLIAELIPLIQDLPYYLTENEDADIQFRCEKYKDISLRYCEMIKELKNETLTYQVYIPKSVFDAACDICKEMQNQLYFWREMAVELFNNNYNNIDHNKADEYSDMILFTIIRTEMAIQKRLEELSGVSI